MKSRPRPGNCRGLRDLLGHDHDTMYHSNGHANVCTPVKMRADHFLKFYPVKKKGHSNAGMFVPISASGVHRYYIKHLHLTCCKRTWLLQLDETGAQPGHICIWTNTMYTNLLRGVGSGHTDVVLELFRVELTRGGKYLTGTF